MRVAVTQFASSSNFVENLATCLRMINETMVCKPSLIVLPEFCNTQPYYQDHNQAWHDALAINGDFLQKIAQQAKNNNCYILINITLRQDLKRDHQNGAIKSNISISSCLFSPLGKLMQQTDKQTLTASEEAFFICTNKASEPIKTSFGKLGVLLGNDDVSFEASRAFALDGAQLLCHSLNSIALEHSDLHQPARACENNLFLASANKIGSLITTEQHQDVKAEKSPEKNSADLAKSIVPNKYLVGIGQSQIVAPDGKVLAKLNHNDEGFVFADINLAGVGLVNKCRPDGTEIMQQRRGQFYQKYAPYKQQVLPAGQTLVHHKVPETANVAIFATYKSNQQAIDDVCHYIENNLSDIIQLPELFFVADKTITNSPESLSQIAGLCTELVKQISAVLRPFQYVCTSLVIDGVHQAVLISEKGLLATQQQLHFCQRYQWTTLGDEINIITIPLEQGVVKLAMLTADDANIPEIVKLVALNSIQILLVPFDIQDPSEVQFSLLSRAAEHRICIVAASREKSFAIHSVAKNSNTENKNKIKQQKSTGLIANLSTELSLSNQFESGKFNGYINKPLIKHQHGKITKAVIYPEAAVNKVIVSTI